MITIKLCATTDKQIELPIAELFNEKMQYGDWDNFALNEGNIGNDGIMCYQKEQMGRGIWIQWNNHDYRKLTLKLSLPTSTEEIQTLFLLVDKLMKLEPYTLTIDGVKAENSDFNILQHQMIHKNQSLLNQLIASILSKKQKTACIKGVRLPLFIGEIEAQSFGCDLEKGFAKFLHDKQVLDIYYALPRLDQEQISATYVVVEGLDMIVPNDPQQLKTLSAFENIDNIMTWNVKLYSKMLKTMIGEVPYDCFQQWIHQFQTTRFDQQMTQIRGLNLDEIKMIVSES